VAILTGDEFLTLLDKVSTRLPPTPLVTWPAGRYIFVGDTHGTTAASKKAISLLRDGKEGRECGSGREGGSGREAGGGKDRDDQGSIGHGPGGQGSGGPPGRRAKAYDGVVFLGDYADRGPEQIENFQHVLSAFIEAEGKVLLLRGNHEDMSVSRHYGFHDLLLERYGPGMVDSVSRFFRRLPLAFLSGKVLAIHGGIPRDGLLVADLEHYSVPDDIWENGVIAHLLWNDPSDEVAGWGPNFRGPGIFEFGKDAFREFMDRNGLALLVRGHQAFQEGYREFFGGKLLSVFSVPSRDGTFKMVEIETGQKPTHEVLVFRTRKLRSE
jgi:diadenosine tetraphosphatase ApaH/serine/threonine PP2A family protein phosphatase